MGIKKEEIHLTVYRGRILGRTWELEHLVIHSDLALLMDFTPPHPKGVVWKLWNVNIVYGHLKSENSPDYVQKPQRNCMLMNSASVQTASLDTG